MSKYSENKPPNLRDAIGWMYDYIEDGKTFLDFGCSTGYFGQLIKGAKRNTVYGVEISPEDVAEARKVLDGVYSFDLDGDWPQKVYERRYDYLFFGDVLEHLKDPGTVLQKAAELLKKNSLIFVSVPNIAHMSIRLELMSGNFEYEPMGILDNTHLKYFTLRSFTDMAKQAGYNVKAYTFTANDFPDATIKRLLDKAGLKPAPKFWKIADSTEARAFQHKFVLEPARRGARSAVSLKSVPAKPEQARNALLDDLTGQAKALRKHAKEQAKLIEHYVAKNQELEQRNTALTKRLHRIESSKVYKALRRLGPHKK